MQAQRLVENPLGIEWTSFITLCDTFMGTILQWLSCEYFCQKWNIAKASHIFDFDATALEKLQKFLKSYSPLFKTPGKNIFRDDMVKLEVQLQLAL